MKSTIQIFLAVFLTAAFVFAPFETISFAEDSPVSYYFDAENGNDENSGTSEEEAFQSLKVIDTLEINPGDKLLLKCGQVFSGGLAPSVSGTKDAHITL